MDSEEITSWRQTRVFPGDGVGSCVVVGEERSAFSREFVALQAQRCENASYLHATACL